MTAFDDTEDALVYSIIAADYALLDEVLADRNVKVGQYAIATAAIYDRDDMMYALYSRKYPKGASRVFFGDASARLEVFIDAIVTVANARRGYVHCDAQKTNAAVRLAFVGHTNLVNICSSVMVSALEHDIVLVMSKGHRELIKLFFDCPTLSSDEIFRRLLRDVAPRALFMTVDVLLKARCTRELAKCSNAQYEQILTYLVHCNRIEALLDLSRSNTNTLMFLTNTAIAARKYNLVMALIGVDEPPSLVPECVEA